jgi:hypothetical protein
MGGLPRDAPATKRPTTTDGPTLLATLLPYTPPCKVAWRTRKSVAFTNMNNGSRWAAENVQFLVVSRCRSAVAGLVLFVIGHSLS